MAGRIQDDLHVHLAPYLAILRDELLAVKDPER